MKHYLTDSLEEIKSLIEIEVVPFSDPVKIRTRLRIIDQDPSDNKFLELAVDGKANAVVSSDKHLLDLASYGGIEMISVAEFLKRLK
jgi:putative PIN family toxin of toxin-antitoxin system